MKKDDECSLTVVYDNRSVRKDLVADWGFGCIVTIDGSTVLFDTGAKEEILSHNIKSLYGSSLPLKEAKLILSHDHLDHVGGVLSVVKNYSNTCYVPSSFSKKLTETITLFGSKVICVNEKTEVCPNMWSTGEMTGFAYEQVLVIKTHGKLIVLTGCAHPGVVTIVEKVISHFEEPPYMILGGFHWYKASMSEVEAQVNCLRELGVQKVAPCHCTGDRVIAWMRENWKEGVVNVGVGTRLYL